jgi:perosamine synthetase
MVTARDEKLIRRMERQKAFGVDKTVAERSVPGVYDVTMLGYNYRMNEMAAAIGIEQLKRVAGFLAARDRNTKVLRKGLAEIAEISVLDAGGGDFVHSNYCVAAVLDDKTAAHRTAIIAGLNAAGVGTSIYYPQAVPDMTYYRTKYSTQPGQFPNASRISNQSIALTVGPHVDEEDMNYTVSALKEAIRKSLS